MLTVAYVVFISAIVMAYIYFAYVWPLLALRSSPRTDQTFIRARLDGEAHRVVELERDGSDLLAERSGVRAWRKYRVVTQFPDGSRQTRIVGVQATLLSTPDLVIYKNGLRTQAQVGLF